MNLPPLESFAPFLTLLWQASIPVIGLFIARRVAAPRDHERAVKIAALAEAAAVVAVNLFPGSTSEAVNNVLRQLRAASGLTGNDDVLRRAATAAVIKAQQAAVR